HELRRAHDDRRRVSTLSADERREHERYCQRALHPSASFLLCSSTCIGETTLQHRAHVRQKVNVIIRRMPIGTAVHDRTFQLCESLNYREWSGYYAVSAYEAHHEHEYNAIRNASALIDVTPLFKYLISGKDAVRLVDRLITRDA